MREPILAVLAAGMGSRYGGLKQIEPVGPCGELLIDYSVYDAIKAGFERVVFIIRPEYERDFEDTVAARVRPFADVSYVHQRIGDLPDGFVVPEGRVKPWGTAHALVAARNALDAPFAVINADDYYGPNSYAQVYEFLKRPPVADGKKHFTLVSYRIENTVTEHGSVARGVCRVGSDEYLEEIVERVNIKTSPEGIYDESASGERLFIPDGTPVSMNLWGLTPEYISETWERFSTFLSGLAKEDLLKAEYRLPNTVFDMVRAGEADVLVSVSHDKWHGVTYREDRQRVVSALGKMHEAGEYPTPLWG